MLYWTFMFLVLAIIAGVLGFGGLAGASAHIAQVLFFFAIVAVVVSFLFNAFRGRSPRV